MLIKVFEISSFNIAEDEECVNAFLRTHKILKVDKEFFHHEGVGHWSLLVSYLAGNNESGFGRQQDVRKPKVDYKQVLDETRFRRFEKLREIRKQIAKDDAVPAYSVFTDAELAEMSGFETVTPQTLLKLSGVGEKRVEKYGVRFCELLDNGNYEP